MEKISPVSTVYHKVKESQERFAKFSYFQNPACLLILTNYAPHWIIITQTKVKTTPGSCLQEREPEHYVQPPFLSFGRLFSMIFGSVFGIPSTRLALLSIKITVFMGAVSPSVLLWGKLQANGGGAIQGVFVDNLSVFVIYCYLICVSDRVSVDMIQWAKYPLHSCAGCACSVS